MRFLFKDFRRGVVKLLVESLDDLWYLSQVVAEGDFVESKTTRKVKGREEGMDAERRTVTLEIRVEKVEFKSDSNTLKLLGEISNGPSDVVQVGSHHSFNVGLEDVVSVRKERWFESDLARLKEAVDSSLKPRVLIAVIDEGEASFGLVRASRIDRFDLTSAVGGKFEFSQREKKKADFYAKTLEFIQNLVSKEDVKSVIVAGAGFEKESFLSYVSEKSKELAGKMVLEHTGSHGPNAVNEVLKRPVLKKVLEDMSSALDVNLVNRLLEHIGRDDGLAVYGFSEIEGAVNLNAVELLLVLDSSFMNQRERLEVLMQAVKHSKGTVHIVNHEGEAGQQLKALGGLAGVLRFKIR
jgi:protein pelota